MTGTEACQFVYDVKCSTLIRDTVQRLGGKPVMIRTGSSFLRKYLAQSQHQAIFGGEYAGHYVLMTDVAGAMMMASMRRFGSWNIWIRKV